MSLKFECAGCGGDCSHAYGTYMGLPYHFGCIPMKKPKAKERFCWFCGASLDVIEDRYYQHDDTCGKLECARELRLAREKERHEAHEQLDRDRGWDW